MSSPSNLMSKQHVNELTARFEENYSRESLEELIRQLMINVRKILAIIDTVSDRELFEPGMRKWAAESTKSGDWPMVRFIHINTISPFKSFRTKIRKWKKAPPVS